MIHPGDLFAPAPKPSVLRDYQRDAANGCTAALRAGLNPALEMPTAGGKGPIIAHVILQFLEDNPDAEVWVYAHRMELIQQLSTHLYNLGVPHGVIAPWAPLTLDRVQVCSVQTITARLEKLAPRLGRVRLQVDDECHHSRAAGYELIRQQCPNAQFFGATATLFRTDGASLGSVYNIAIRGPSIKELERRGWISTIQLIDDNPKTLDLSKVRKTMGDLAAGQLDKLINTDEFIKKTLVTYVHRAGGMQALGFYPGVASAVAAAKAFHLAGWRVAVLEANMAPENMIPGQPRNRTAVADAMRTGRVQIVFQVGMAGEGTDWPDIAVGIDCRNTLSTQLWLQHLGRERRPIVGGGKRIDDFHTDAERLAAIAAGPKPFAIWLDMVGNWKTHGAPNADRITSLEGGLKGQERAVAAVRRCGACHRVHERGPERCPTCNRKYPAPRETAARAAPAFTPGSRTALDDMTTAEIAGSSLTRLRALMKTREHVERVQRIKGFKPAWVNYELRDMRFRSGQSF